MSEEPLNLDVPTDPPEPTVPKRVLALAGGGFRGLFTTEVLIRLEKELGQPLAKAFDLVIGTSAGALIAAGVANGVPAAKIGQAFREWGEKIFPPSPFKKARQYLFGAPYAAEPLSSAIDAVLGEKSKCKMRDCTADLAVTAVSQTASAARIYTAGRFRGVGVGELTLREAILASAAAPTYFPPRRPDAETLVDGGIMANAPELAGLGLANAVFGGLERIRVLAVGTASPKAGRPALTPGAYSFAGWMRPSRNLLLLTLEVQEDLATKIAGQLLRENYWKIDEKPSADQARVMGDLDQVGSEAMETMAAMAELAWTRDKARVMQLLG